MLLFKADSVLWVEGDTSPTTPLRRGRRLREMRALLGSHSGVPPYQSLLRKAPWLATTLTWHQLWAQFHFSLAHPGVSRLRRAHSPTHLRGGLHPVLDTAPQSICAAAVRGVGGRAEGRAWRELITQVDGLILSCGREVHGGHSAVAIRLREGRVALRAARSGWVQGGGAIAAATLGGGVV